MTPSYQSLHSRRQKRQKECKAQHWMMDFTLRTTRKQAIKLQTTEMRNTTYKAPNSTFFVAQQMICAPLLSFAANEGTKTIKICTLCGLCSNGAGHSFSSGLWVMWSIIVRKMSLAHVYTSRRTDGSIHTILFSLTKAIRWHRFILHSTLENI